MTLTNQPVAVIGAGLVGAGWAIAFARAGLNVRIYDANPDTARAAIPWAENQLKALHEHGLIEETPEVIAARLSLATTLAQAIDGAAYAQESVLERVDVKRKLMLELDAVADDTIVIGSSSSGIKASDFANDLGISPRVLIAHPVNPPYLVPVVELVPSTQTSPETVAFTDELMRGIGQSVVHVKKEIEGFVLNRLQAALLREAWALQRDGIASCEDIDKTVRDGLGWRWSFMGPFETIDLNAPGGVADYARRLGPLYHSIARSRDGEGPWDDAWIAGVEADRRQHLAQDELAARRDWRDERLMRFAVERAKDES
jgi:L-gulonate 3-dehydrogenase